MKTEGIDGAMFDAPHLKQAQRLLAQSDAAGDPLER